MRVHELAKELGFENKEFIDKLKKVGVEVKSHLSGLSDEQEKSIRNKMKKAQNPETGSKSDKIKKQKSFYKIELMIFLISK